MGMNCGIGLVAICIVVLMMAEMIAPMRVAIPPMRMSVKISVRLFAMPSTLATRNATLNTFRK